MEENERPDKRADAISSKEIGPWQGEIEYQVVEEGRSRRRTR